MKCRSYVKSIALGNHDMSAQGSPRGKATLRRRLATALRVGVAGLVALAASTTPSDAKTLYVNGTTGNDSVSYAANGPGSPWRTIGRALQGSTDRGTPNGAEAARAGDVVDIACGLYETTGTNTNGFGGIALMPVNNGTANAPIRIQSSGNTFACIQVRFSSGIGSVIGSVDRSYIQWSGFDLNEVNTPWDVSRGHQSAQLWISGNEAGTTAVGNMIENSRFRGTSTSSRDGDNYTVIRLHGTRGTVIRNVHVSDVGMTDENSGCILWYFTRDVTIENNLFERCGSGIYMKGEADPSRTGFYHIRRNRFIDNHAAIIAFTAANGAPTTPGIIAQNIFKGGEYGIMFNRIGTDLLSAPNDLKFVNNLFLGQVYGGYPVEVRGELIDNAGMLFQNNIMIASGWLAYGSAGGGSSASLQTNRLLARHNVYQNVNAERFAGLGIEFPFSAWQGTFGQDTASPAGIITSATLFADADYRPAANSPTLNRGRAIYGVGGADGATVNAGPYILGTEVIGLLGSSPSPRPAAPTNLRISGS